MMTATIRRPIGNYDPWEIEASGTPMQIIARAAEWTGEHYIIEFYFDGRAPDGFPDKVLNRGDSWE